MENREKNIVWRWMLKVEKTIMVASVISVTLIMFFETILRRFQINFIGYEELVIIAAFWMYMMGSAYGTYEKSQIRADVLSVMMKDGIRKDIAKLIERILTLTLCLIFLYWTWNFVMWSAEAGATTPAWRIPNVVGQSSVAVGLTLMTVYNIGHLWDTCLELYRKYFSKGN